MHKPRWCHWPASPPRCQHGARDEHSPAPACAQRLMVRWLSHFVTPQAPAQQQRCAARQGAPNRPASRTSRCQPAPPAPARVQRQSTAPPTASCVPPTPPPRRPPRPPIRAPAAAARPLVGQLLCGVRRGQQAKGIVGSISEATATRRCACVRMIETSQALQKGTKVYGGGAGRRGPVLAGLEGGGG